METTEVSELQETPMVIASKSIEATHCITVTIEVTAMADRHEIE